MRLRVHLTNGCKTISLFWLEHTDTDVYFGYYRNEKFSYHESGQFHIKENDKIVLFDKRVPIKKLQGIKQLGGIGFFNNSILFESTPFFKESSGKKIDCVLSIDSRSFPENIQLFVSIGLLQPDRLDCLDRIMGPKSVRGQVEQLLLTTNVKPWVWTTLRRMS